MLLLDTHALVWLVTDSPKLGKLARRHAARGAHVSAITFWELEMLAEAGRVRLGMTAARLGMHGDPGDRFIVATALTHGATLMTAKDKIRAMKRSHAVAL